MRDEFLSEVDLDLKNLGDEEFYAYCLIAHCTVETGGDYLLKSPL
jgi:hypothetical protein